MDLQLPSKQKFVLLCIANNADDFGAAFPSVASLSQDTCIPERTVQRLVGWLLESHYVISYWDYHPNDKLRRKKIRFFRLNLSGKPRTIKPDYSNCPTALRYEVIQRFSKTCSYCGGVGDDKKGPDRKAWEIDRIIPGSQGGGYVADNVTLACGPCNRSKGANLAPSNKPELAPQKGADPTNLGAILDNQGCQNDETVVPPVAHYPSVKPSDQPSINHTAADARGTRIPKDFSLTDSMREWGTQETPHVDLDDALKEFVDYWSDIAGKAGVKLSWDGTWRNRMRELEKRAVPKNGNGRVRFDPARGGAEPSQPRPSPPKAIVSVDELRKLGIEV